MYERNERQTELTHAHERAQMCVIAQTKRIDDSQKTTFLVLNFTQRHTQTYASFNC